MIKILIADDHPMLIDGIRTTLRDVPEIEVAATANDGYQVLKILGEQPGIDIVLMDINMPKLDGLDCTRMMARQFPDVRVIALSQYDDKRFVKRMVKNGASGYLLKDAGRDDLIEAITRVHGGGKYFCPRLSMSLVNQELKIEDTKSLFPKLTGRELEVLNLICNEHSTQEIADKLFISFHTVESHRANLMYKAGAKNTAGLVRWAVENDLIN